MSEILRFFSGEVPGGFLALLGILLAIGIIGSFLHRFSEVIDKRKLRRGLFVVFGLLIFTYVVVRMARPPKPRVINIAVFPLATETSDSSFIGLGWAVSEVISRTGEMASPPHVMFVRPHWLSESFESETQFRPDDPNRVKEFCRVHDFEYAVFGSATGSSGGMRLAVTLLDVDDDQMLPRETVVNGVTPLQASEGIVNFAEDIVASAYRLIDEPMHQSNIDNSVYRHSALIDYATVQRLLADSQIHRAHLLAVGSLLRDSSSVLSWMAMGYVETEMMIWAEDETVRNRHMKRAEYHLKRGGLLSPEFQPVYPALVRLYMLVRPEARYLDAEFAMIDGHQIYDRDYSMYYFLSFMNKMRWESFQLTTLEQVLERALEINPAGLNCMIRLAEKKIEFARPTDRLSEEALILFRKAYAMRPNSRSAVAGLITMYDHLTRYDEALRLIEEAHRKFPNDAQFHYTQGVVHFHYSGLYKAKKKTQEETDQLSKAERSFQEAVRLSDDAYSHLYLGKIYDYQKRREEAVREFRSVMRILPRDDPYRDEARKKLREYFPDVE